ncbi:endonuclease III [Thiorhodospira sibirica]|uniref:endonuclease III n=1 Tax=Thiorhodospira sibirica TaxID=154347 RepID=UPI00022C2DC7|nr:endonuclease III [Thiorhodospira sibirica]
MPPKAISASRRSAQIFERLAHANPHPTTELLYENPFQLLIAVMLSAQATDKSVNRVTPGLFAQAPTPQAMFALGVEGIKAHIKTIGLYNHKAAHIHQSCAILLHQHQGQVPRERAQLEALPGVGRKTANVILNTAFGEPTIAVDTHIFRVANRTGIAEAKTVNSVEKILLEVVPDSFKQHAHHWLILHGRYTCTARKPACNTCLIADLCKTVNTAP